MVLNTKFTLEFVIWPETAGSLLMVETELLDIYFNAHLFNEAPQFDFANVSVSAGLWTESTWQNIAFVVDRIDENTSSVQIYKDGLAIDTAVTIEGLIIDTLENTHVIGRGFQGFLYKL